MLLSTTVEGYRLKRFKVVVSTVHAYKVAAQAGAHHRKAHLENNIRLSRARGSK